MTIEDFLSRVDTSGDCWAWTGGKYATGYGCIGRHGYAHRVSYELHVGPIPDGMIIDHRCRNRACVNPAHLRLATVSQNNSNRPARRGRFKGVGWHRRAGAWRAYIAANGKSLHLGLFPTEEAAARAYNEAARTMHGEFAYLNDVPS